MATILVTGTSGFIGHALADTLSRSHEVICFSRRPTKLDLPSIEADFSGPENLASLDSYRIDAVVHLAAVTGGCSERDGMQVNVEGSRVLMRYLIDHGCSKYVMASSIAAVGMQRPDFVPQMLPIPDEHPCLDRDGYGFSKYMMEEVTRYHWRQNPGLDVINLRLSSVVPDERGLGLTDSSAEGEWRCGRATQMVLSDAVRAFTLAVKSPHQAGVRVLNTCGPEACVSEPTATVLRAWMGDRVDVSYYQRPENEFAAIYDPASIRRELGFVAKVLPKRD